MAISTEFLKDRYEKANEALDKYGALMADRLSTGNTSPSQIQKFNLMSAWISFMSSKITVPSTVQAKSPDPIRFPIPSLTNSKFTIGVDKINGEFTPIINFPSYNLNETFNNLTGQSFSALLSSGIWNNYVNPDFVVSTDDREEKVIISFPATGIYNESSLTFYPQPSNFRDNLDLKVKGGVSRSSVQQYVSVEDRELFNNLLEEIAIELKISY
jgi:hypothetical protein|tara:strand:+ start:617 stop:1258 length:642 start_codon:yes stop_codon:yes gene_type:complete